MSKHFSKDMKTGDVFNALHDAKTRTEFNSVLHELHERTMDNPLAREIVKMRGWSPEVQFAEFVLGTAGVMAKIEDVTIEDRWAVIRKLDPKFSMDD